MRLFLPCLLLFFGVHGASAKGLIEQGRAILQADCSRCHAIGKTGFSPFKPAPPFRDVMKRYKAEDLAEGLSRNPTVRLTSTPCVGCVGGCAKSIRSATRANTDSRRNTCITKSGSCGWQRVRMIFRGRPPEVLSESRMR